MGGGVGAASVDITLPGVALLRADRLRVTESAPRGVMAPRENGVRKCPDGSASGCASGMGENSSGGNSWSAARVWAAIVKARGGCGPTRHGVRLPLCSACRAGRPAGAELRLDYTPSIEQRQRR